MVLTSRGRRGTLPDEVTRLGTLCGGAVLRGGAVAGAGLLLPATSRLRWAALAAGTAPGALGVLAIPSWLLRLGRALPPTAAGPRRSRPPRTSS